MPKPALEHVGEDTGIRQQALLVVDRCRTWPPLQGLQSVLAQSQVRSPTSPFGMPRAVIRVCRTARAQLRAPQRARSAIEEAVS